MVLEPVRLQKITLVTTIAKTTFCCTDATFFQATLLNKEVCAWYHVLRPVMLIPSLPIAFMDINYGSRNCPITPLSRTIERSPLVRAISNSVFKGPWPFWLKPFLLERFVVQACLSCDSRLPCDGNEGDAGDDALVPIATKAELLRTLLWRPRRFLFCGRFELHCADAQVVCPGARRRVQVMYLKLCEFGVGLLVTGF